MDPRDLREKLGLGQKEFWLRVGVTQSGGSRYEAGRRLPSPVEQLLRLYYIEQIDLETMCWWLATCGCISLSSTGSGARRRVHWSRRLFQFQHQN
jgi:transcriptional regulator with XRE-family HTH domain